MQLWRNDVNLYAIIMDKNVAGLKICSTKLTEITKNKIIQVHLNFLLKLYSCTIYKYTAVLHVPMGKVHRENSALKLDNGFTP